MKNGYTHQDMANYLNISKSFYWQIECGKRTLSYKMAIKIGKVFHKMPDDIFYDEFKSKE
jgi:putative transcriptional regulator